MVNREILPGERLAAAHTLPLLVRMPDEAALFLREAALIVLSLKQATEQLSHCANLRSGLSSG